MKYKKCFSIYIRILKYYEMVYVMHINFSIVKNKSFRAFFIFRNNQIVGNQVRGIERIDNGFFSILAYIKEYRI